METKGHWKGMQLVEVPISVVFVNNIDVPVVLLQRVGGGEGGVFGKNF